jgi:hypothetical protein
MQWNGLINARRAVFQCTPVHPMIFFAQQQNVAPHKIFTANFLRDENAARLFDLISSENKISGGVSDSDVKELMVMPMASPLWVAVTTDTPAARLPNASLNCASLNTESENSGESIAIYV